MTYGVQPTGYVRKPLSVILAELEAAMATEFGPGVIQTPQSPLGQLNGLMADLLAEVDERNLDLYQSYDPDQAESTRLDILAKLRLLRRGGGEPDPEFRQAVTNLNRARNDIQDLARAVRGLEGVTYVQVFVNDSTEVNRYGMPPGSVSVAVLGGDDEEVAQAMRLYVVPGVIVYGNTEVSTNVDGYCRSMRLIRPILVDTTLQVNVRLSTDAMGCPPPSLNAIRDGLMAALQGERRLMNGEDITYFRIRSIIESMYPNVEVVIFEGTRDGEPQGLNQIVRFGFVEMANITEIEVGIVA